MKKRVEEVRSRMIVVRLNEEEYQRLQKLQSHTTERLLSAYLRKKRKITRHIVRAHA